MTLNEQKEELKSFLLSKQNTGQCNLYWLKNHYKEIYDDLLTWTFPSSFSFTQKLYHYLNDDKELKLGHCIICGKSCKFCNFKLGYALHCSKKCVGKDKEIIEKTKQTNLERYGVENYSQTKECKEKVKDTCLEKYGVKSYSQTEEYIKKKEQTLYDRYGDENYNNREKAKQTLIKDFGSVENAYKEASNKTKQTCLEKFGVDNPMKSEEVKNKAKNTCLEKYGKEKYSQTDECKEKQKQTCLDKYGVDSYSKTDEFKEKSKKTSLERHEGQGNASEEIKEKQKQTCLDRYGKESYMQTDEFKEKTKETCLERYGAESYTQSEDYLKKSYETKKKNNSFNSSKIENEFANYLEENNIKFESQYRSELYPFCCDFYLSEYNLYIEIQGNWTHGEHPFNSEDENDNNILSGWIEKSNEHPYYLKAIDVWTNGDVKKRNIAKENNLNYLEIFSCKLDECVLFLNQKIN